MDTALPKMNGGNKSTGRKHNRNKETKQTRTDDHNEWKAFTSPI